MPINSMQRNIKKKLINLEKRKNSKKFISQMMKKLQKCKLE